jgi:hypothetical protein
MKRDTTWMSLRNDECCPNAGVAMTITRLVTYLHAVWRVP